MLAAGQGASVRVFISYSTTDRALVDPLKDRLKQAGVDVWLDHERLTPDTLDWQAAIRKGIDQATHLIYAASEAAARSRYVVHELEMARGKNKRVICFWVRDAEWYDCTPMGWFSAQRIDGRGASFDAGVAELIAALGLSARAPAQPAPQLAAPARQPAAAPAHLPGHHMPSYPLSDVPARLANLGFRGVNVNGTPAIVPPLIAIPAGPFLMGSDKSRDKEALDNETPQHRVEVAAFQIAKYPVTVAEYVLAVRAGAVREPEVSSIRNLDIETGTWEVVEVTWTLQQQHSDHPVVGVSWQDAMTYIAWLKSATGQRGWRLPTEAEWEKAARWDLQRGVSRIYPWGDSFDKERCNSGESDFRTTSPVGSYPPDDTRHSGASPFGVEEMVGNVWEWCSNLYKPYPYVIDDGREDQISTDYRTMRGGSWDTIASGVRAASRNNSWWDLLEGVGFRLAFSSPGAGSS